MDRVREIRGLRDLIEQGKRQSEDSSLFAGILRSTRDVLGVEQKKLASIFQVSPPTVSRWVNEHNCPHPIVRSAGYDRLEAFVSERLREEERVARRHEHAATAA